MPRKKKNARSLDRPKKIKTQVPKVRFLKIHKRLDDISPGVLVAMAEWKEVRY